MIARAFFLTSLAAVTTTTTAAAAQVPFEHFVVSTRSPGSGSAAWFVDPGTGDVTPITGLVAPLDELTIVTEEPMSGALYLGEALSSSPTMQFVPLAGRSAGGALRVTWFGPRGPMSDALFGAGGNLFMLIGGSATGAGLYTGVLIGGPAVLLGAVADGVAIAADANAVYVLTNKTGFPSTIWRYDVVTSAFTQVVAAVPPAKAFDLFPGGTSKLLVGGQSGDLYLADAATGQVSLYQAVGRGAIAALRHSRAGTTLFATDTGGLYTLASLPNALAQLPRVPTDIDVGTMDAASFFTFGNGCAGSGNFVPTIGATGLPAVGNAGFALTVAAGPGGAPAIFALGNSRKSWGAIPLPFDLAGVGAAGCAIAANGVVLSALALSGSGAGSGTATLPLPIPNQLALVGVKLMAQWWILDPPANALGLTVSDGGEAVVR